MGSPLIFFIFFFSEEHQAPSSVSVLALLFGTAEKYLPSPSSRLSCFSSPDAVTTKTFFKKAVAASRKQSMRTNEDSAIGADLLLSPRQRTPADPGDNKITLGPWYHVRINPLTSSSVYPPA